LLEDELFEKVYGQENWQYRIFLLFRYYLDLGVWCRAVRRRAAAAAADHMSASRRRRFRGVLTSCRTPAIMLLDFCNAVYNEA